MESSPSRPDLAAALADAESSRRSFAAGVAVPDGYEHAMGAAIAVQVATTALGITRDGTGAAIALVGGLVLFALVAAAQLVRFRRRNGVWLGGFASAVVLGTAPAASVVYAAALAGAVAAATQDLWALVVLAAVAGGTGYVLSGRRWLRRYRADPATLGAGESALWLAGLAVLGVGGLVLVLVGR